LAIGLRHGASAADNARSRPEAKIVAVNNDPPAWETTPAATPKREPGERNHYS